MILESLWTTVAEIAVRKVMYHKSETVISEGIEVEEVFDRAGVFAIIRVYLLAQVVASHNSLIYIIFDVH